MGKLSVVVPVYYNEGSLAILHRRLAEVAAKVADFEWEFVFVDDGSGDASFGVLSSLAALDPRVRVIKLVRNFGSTTAILAGLAHASGDAVAVISADLQDPPEIILDMLPGWRRGVPMIFAARTSRDDPLSTRLPAGIFNSLFRRLAFKNYPRNGFDCFLIDRRVVDVVVRCAEKNTHLPGLLMWSGFQHEMVYYDRQKREHGKSRWNLGRKLKYFADAFAAFSYFPLRLCSTLGLIVACIGLIYAAVVAFLTLIGAITVEGWSSLMIVVLITSGLQMLMLGVIGEYLWRTFDQARSRPAYLIEQIVESQPPTVSATEAHLRQLSQEALAELTTVEEGLQAVALEPPRRP